MDAISQEAIAVLRIELNLEEAREALRRAKLALQDMTPVYAEIGEYMIGATRDRFAKGIAPDGTAWACSRRGPRYRR